MIFEGGPKVRINSDEIEALIKEIESSSIPFTHIVGISRGGLVPAVYVSHYFRLPLAVAKVKTFFADDLELYGEPKSAEVELLDDKHSSIDASSRILVVDDISDSGMTLRAIVEHLRVISAEVYAATIHCREGTVFEPDFYAVRLSEKDPWVTYPWENDHNEISQ